MSRNSTHIDASPDRIFDVLDDARAYDHWVVGCQDIRAVDPEWPAPGSSFHHSVGVGPLTLDDSTSILERQRPLRLKLRARARPTGIAHVDIHLRPNGSGTEVIMLEEPVKGLAAILHNPLQDKLLHRRNVEALRRLKWLAERG